MSTVGTEYTPHISIKGSPDYLHRVERIVECVADHCGLDSQDSVAAQAILTRFCAESAASHDDNTSDAFSLELNISTSQVVASIPLSSADECQEHSRGICHRIIQMMAKGIRLITSRNAVKLRISRRNRTALRLTKTDPSAISRN